MVCLRFTGRVFVEIYSYPLTESVFRYIKLCEMFFVHLAVGPFGAEPATGIAQKGIK